MLWDLGQGEFGKVRACVVDKNADAKAKDGEYALKSVNKNDVRVVVASSLLVLFV